MSIPSSRLLVAIRHGSSPALSISSTIVRSSRASEPWWARAMSSPASSFRRSASRSAARRALTKMIVERCARTSLRSSGYIAGQIELRVDSPPAPLSSGSLGPLPGSTIDSTGTWIFRSRGFLAPASTTRQVRCGPTRKRPISSSGFWVALSPMRCGSPSARSLSRSSVSARCEPRLVDATAWISSTITASTPVSISRAWLVRIRYSDSGVVMRMSGGWRRIAMRSFCGVSPVRIATEMSRSIPRSGARRLRSMS